MSVQRHQGRYGIPHHFRTLASSRLFTVNLLPRWPITRKDWSLEVIPLHTEQALQRFFGAQAPALRPSETIESQAFCSHLGPPRCGSSGDYLSAISPRHWAGTAHDSDHLTYSAAFTKTTCRPSWEREGWPQLTPSHLLTFIGELVPFLR